MNTNAQTAFESDGNGVQLTPSLKPDRTVRSHYLSMKLVLAIN